MELKVVPKERLICKGLGITEERLNQLLDLAKDWLKDQFKNDKQVDKLDLCQYCASISDSLEEYTTLMFDMREIVERAQIEIHEENCPRCKARKAASESEENSSFSSKDNTGPIVHQVAQGVYVIGL